MNRKRRCNRSANPRKLDETVVMVFFGQDTGETENLARWAYRSVARRVAQEMVLAGDAESLVVETANGRITMYQELKPTAFSYNIPAMLTERTLHAVAANQPGARLSAGQRQEIAKFRLWPYLGNENPAMDKCTVRPRTTPSDLERARAIWNNGGERRPATAGRCYREHNRSEIRTLRIDEPAEVSA